MKYFEELYRKFREDSVVTFLVITILSIVFLVKMLNAKDKEDSVLKDKIIFDLKTEISALKDDVRFRDRKIEIKDSLNAVVAYQLGKAEFLLNVKK